MIRSCRTLLAVVLGVGLFLDTVEAQRYYTPWTSLRVKFSVNPFSQYYYQPQPRHVTDMRPNAWRSISNGDCTNGGRYSGFRFVESVEAPGIALLYDVQGTVSGIQMILDKNEIERNNDFRFDRLPFFNPDNINGRPAYVLTAYFVDPKTICTKGRAKSELIEPGGSGTGTVILVQNGTSPDHLLLVPRTRKEALAAGWSRNECMLGMGHHNFYKVEDWAREDCREIVPYFGVYDRKGYLTALGFVAIGDVKRPHFENLPKLLMTAAGNMIVGPSAPQCFSDKGLRPGMTTMHVFFTEHANLVTCIGW